MNFNIDRARLIKQVAPSSTPLLARGRLFSKIIENINRNTLQLQAPRQVGFDAAAAAAAAAKSKIGRDQENLTGELTEGVDPDAPFTSLEIWGELSRITSTVRVEDPTNSSAYVDVSRIDRILFVKNDGQTAELIFNNPTTE